MLFIIKCRVFDDHSNKVSLIKTVRMVMDTDLRGAKEMVENDFLFKGTRTQAAELVEKLCQEYNSFSKALDVFSFAEATVYKSHSVYTKTSNW